MMRPIRRALAVAALAFSFGLALAGTAWAEAFTISISSPSSGAVLYGNTTVRIEYNSTGETPTGAAFKLSPSGSWVGDGVPMSQSGSGYVATFDSNVAPNGSYTLIARAWGGSYDPEDSSSYAQATAPVKVNNAPPAPSGLAASGSGGSVTITWAGGEESRSDFQGFQVYRAAASGGSCPGIGSFSSRASVNAPSYSESISNTYCYAVVAKRYSPQSGTITSDFSAPVMANGSGQVDGGGGNGGGGGGGGNGGGGSGGGGGNVEYVRYGRAGGGSAPAPPEAPEVREIVQDGPFKEHLPYAPVSVEEFNRIVSEGSGISGGLVAADARHRAMTLVAAGLLLGVSAMQIRRFVSSG